VLPDDRGIKLSWVITTTQTCVSWSVKRTASYPIGLSFFSEMWSNWTPIVVM